MIYSLLFLPIAKACIGPHLEDRNFELKYEYRFENRENPMSGKGVSFSNVYYRDLDLCRDAAESFGVIINTYLIPKAWV